MFVSAFCLEYFQKNSNFGLVFSSEIIQSHNISHEHLHRAALRKRGLKMSNQNFILALIKHITADPGILKIVHCRWTHGYILNHRFPLSEIFHWQAAHNYLLLHHRASQSVRQKSIKNTF